MISIRELHKNFGPLEVLRGVSLEVGQGEVAVLLGPSGCGKSTMLRCINGLETFDRGEIQIAGEKLLPGIADRAGNSRLREVRQKVGMVFQQFNLFPHRTVLGNVIEAPVQVLGLSREEATARAKVLLDRVGLSQKYDTRPEQLSGGQQQRAAIARALAMQPQAILFDEPTSSLDPKMTAEVLAVMADLAKQGQTMIVVTHAMQFARRVATKVHVLHAGQVIESGPPEQIFNRPEHAETVALVRELE